jgi:hypothetical protein
MRKQVAVRAEANLSLYGGQIPIFDQIAIGFLKELSSHRQSMHATACLDYLDGKIKVDCDWYTRRSLILAVEDLKQQSEAPLRLRREVYDFMKLLDLTPIPELKLYRDVATAILRIDATLHLSRIGGARKVSGSNPAYH